MPWGVSFLVLSIWYFCASYIWVSIIFLHFRKFKFSSMILLKSRSMPLTWNSSSSMSIKGPRYSFFKKKKSVSLRNPTPLAWLQALIFCLLPDWFCWYGFPVRFFIEWLIFFITIIVLTWIFFNPISLMSSLFIFWMSEVSGQAEGQSQGA